MGIVACQSLAVGCDPVGRVEEQRLRLHIGGRAAVVQQFQAHRETARTVRVGAAPGIDRHQALQQLRPQQGDLQADQPTEGMADEVAAADAQGVQQLQQFHCHGLDGIARRQVRRALVGPQLIVDQHPVVLGQRRQLRRPEGAGAAEAGAEHQSRRIWLHAAMKFVVHVTPSARSISGPPACRLTRSGRRYWPTWAMLAISISASGFTSPHWMQ